MAMPSWHELHNGLKPQRAGSGQVGVAFASSQPEHTSQMVGSGQSGMAMPLMQSWQEGCLSQAEREIIDVSPYVTHNASSSKKLYIYNCHLQPTLLRVFTTWMNKTIRTICTVIRCLDARQEHSDP